LITELRQQGHAQSVCRFKPKRTPATIIVITIIFEDEGEEKGRMRKNLSSFDEPSGSSI
jgi:hypothetical protein